MNQTLVSEQIRVAETFEKKYFVHRRIVNVTENKNLYYPYINIMKREEKKSLLINQVLTVPGYCICTIYNNCPSPLLGLSSFLIGHCFSFF